jgi:hypothetical protein
MEKKYLNFRPKIKLDQINVLKGNYFCPPFNTLKEMNGEALR